MAAEQDSPVNLILRDMNPNREGQPSPSPRMVPANIQELMPNIFNPYRLCRSVSNCGNTTSAGIKAQEARDRANWIANVCCEHAMADGIPGTMSATDYFAEVAKYFIKNNDDISLSQLPTADASLPADIVPGTRGTRDMTLQQYHDYISGLLNSLPKC